jgi:frizzled protein 1/7
MKVERLKMFMILMMSAAVATLTTATRTSSMMAMGGLNNPKCEPITIPMCKDLPYKKTLFPNLMSNDDQEEASREIHTFNPLVKVNCSPDIRLFLCSMFAPVCTILEKPLPPCRDLCESAKEGCEELMIRFGYLWPNAFDCSTFPIGGRPDDLCVGRMNSSMPNNNDLEKFRTSTALPRLPNAYEDMMDFVCPSQLAAPRDLDYSLRVGQVVAEDCGAPCYGMFFDTQEVGMIQTWVGVWSILALFSCLFTLATCLIDRSRFPYPQMAIIHLALCYLVVALFYLIGFALNDSVSCGEAFTPEESNIEPEKLIRQGTIEDWRCSVLGMGLYFFTMAGSLWWVMLTIAWFLQAGLKWGSEAIDIKSSYMHAVVWTVAAIQTVMTLVLKKIEGDILSGVCFVGLWDSTSLLYFVIVPKVLYLVVGFVFLFMGFISLYRIRSVLKQEGAKTDKLESLMYRIGKA